jgi:hypothetical protein
MSPSEKSRYVVLLAAVAATIKALHVAIGAAAWAANRSALRTTAERVGSPVCDHYWAWVSPAGTNRSARLCQSCHQPDPVWLNHTIEVRLRDCVNGKDCVHCEFADDDTAPAASWDTDDDAVERAVGSTGHSTGPHLHFGSPAAGWTPTP